MEKNARLEKQILWNKKSRSLKKQEIAARRIKKHAKRMERKRKGKQPHSERNELKKIEMNVFPRNEIYKEMYYPISGEGFVSLGRTYGTFVVSSSNWVWNF